MSEARSLIRRRPVIEEVEPRILYAADFAPHALAHDATLVAEQRVLDDTDQHVGGSDTTAQPRRHEIAFVDPATPDYASLIDRLQRQNDAQRALECVVLDARRDGVAQIAQTLSARQDLDAVHIVSHGSPGSLRLGSGQLDFDALLANAGAIQGWGRSLAPGADLLIYGCDVAGSEDGRSLLQALARLTGADVSASDDRTASAERDGDWELEFVLGSIDTELVLDAATRAGWQGSLSHGPPHAPPAVDGPGNDAPVNTLPATRTTLADQQLIFFPGEIVIDDVDAGAAQIQVSITATNGTMRLGGVPGLTFLAGDWRGDVSMTFRGTLADINSALNNCRFRPDPGFVGLASVTIATDDLGNTGPGGAQTDTDTMLITVGTPVSLPPTLPPPGGGVLPGQPAQPSAAATTSAIAASVTPEAPRTENSIALSSARAANDGPAAATAPATDPTSEGGAAGQTDTAGVAGTSAAGSAQLAADLAAMQAARAPHAGGHLLQAGFASRTSPEPALAAAQLLADLWHDLEAPLLMPVTGLVPGAHASDAPAGDVDRDSVAELVRDLTYTMGFALSVGAVLWANRAGLLASVLLSMPAWRGIDPLPVISAGQPHGSDANVAEGERPRAGTGAARHV